MNTQQSLVLEPDAIEIRQQVGTNPMGRKMPPVALAAINDGRSPIPRALILSSLFKVRRTRGKSTPREQYWEQLLVSVDGIKVNYTGQELDQDDLLVYLEIINLIANQTVDGTIEVDVSPCALMSQMGWSPSKNNYQKLSDTLTRLQATSIKIRGARSEGAHRVSYEYSGSLLPEFRTVTINSRIRLTLGFSVELIKFFWNGVIALHREIIRKLESSQLGRWVYMFFGGDQHERTWNLRTLQDMCGSKAAANRFRYLLETAFCDVRAAGVPLNFEFIGLTDRRSPATSVRVGLRR